MMRTESRIPPISTVFFTLDSMPSFVPRGNAPIQKQIVTYLSKFLEQQNRPGEIAPYVLLPSACQLSGFFHSSELQIIEALQQLDKNNYEYEIRGLDGPICLRDPLGRKGKTKSDSCGQVYRGLKWPWIMLFRFNPQIENSLMRNEEKEA